MHTLLRRRHPVVEHLTGLDRAAPRSPVHGHAAAVVGFGTFPVRANARLPEA